MRAQLAADTGNAIGTAALGAEATAPIPALTFVAAPTDDVIPYDDAWAEQRRLHALRASDQVPDTVLLLQHPPVYTAGRRTHSADRPVDGSPVVDVDRGGRITWHGPGQLVGYPILKLPEPIDVVAHVRRLERALIAVCADLGVAGAPVDGRSGVWVRDSRGDRKIAAIGVRVASGVTMHGFALNCDCDLSAYDSIIPCGIEDAGVTSLSVELGRRVTVCDVQTAVQQAIAAELGAREYTASAWALNQVGAGTWQG